MRETATREEQISGGTGRALWTSGDRLVSKAPRREQHAGLPSNSTLKTSGGRKKHVGRVSFTQLPRKNALSG